jgi:hypothetical protein
MCSDARKCGARRQYGTLETMRRLICVALLAVIGSSLAETDARACTPNEQLTDEKRFEQASAVFVAHVVRMEEGEKDPAVTGAPGPLVNVEFRVIETLKGQPPADNRVIDQAGFGGCPRMPVLVGQDYVFFLLNPVTTNLVWPSGADWIGDAREKAAATFVEKLRGFRKPAR